MILTGTPAEIMTSLTRLHSEVDSVLSLAGASIQHGKTKQSVYSYQAAALYALAKPYNRPECRILEIGTYYGYSAAVLAMAVPDTAVITLNPVMWEAKDARRNLSQFGNVSVVERHSWDYLGMLAPGWAFDFIFVDGDHKRVRLDLPYWNRLPIGGLLVFHDYTPLGAPRHCPPVSEVVNGFAEWLGREPDVLVVDDQKVGMAGFYKLISDPEYQEQGE